jgi:hypothetical protein
VNTSVASQAADKVNLAAKPTIPDVVPLIRAYYAKPGNGAGGNLHIILDDGNVKDDNVKFCLTQAREAGDKDGVRLAELLLRTSKTQRRKIGDRR